MALIDGIVRYFPCDDNAGNTTVTDATGTGNGVASTNTSNLSSTGKINEAFDFDGNTEKVTITNFTNSFEAITVGGWVNLDVTSRSDLGGLWEATGQHQHLLTAGITTGKFQFFTSNNGTSANSSGVSTTTFTVGVWYHVMGTYDGTDVKIFVNGSEENSANFTNGLHNTSTSNNTFGGNFSSTNETNGRIDEWGVWDRALSEAEITELYNSGAGFAYPFATDVTISPSAFTLSTSEQAPSLFIDISQSAVFGLTAGLPVPNMDAPMPFNRGTVGTQDIATRFPLVEGLIAGTTKQTVNPNLEAQEEGVV